MVLVLLLLSRRQCDRMHSLPIFHFSLILLEKGLYLLLFFHLPFDEHEDEINLQIKGQNELVDSDCDDQQDQHQRDLELQHSLLDVIE